jgi:hypothetical protein
VGVIVLVGISVGMAVTVDVGERVMVGEAVSVGVSVAVSVIVAVDETEGIAWFTSWKEQAVTAASKAIHAQTGELRDFRRRFIAPVILPE